MDSPLPTPRPRFCRWHCSTFPQSQACAGQSPFTGTIAEMAGLNIKKSKTKTKTMRINSTNQAPIKLDNDDIENVASFTYLGSVIAVDGGSERDVLVRIGKARTAFLLLRPVWGSKEISLRTKLRIFNTNVKTVLMYGAETWRVPRTSQIKLKPSLTAAYATSLV